MDIETNKGEEFQVDLTNCDREPIHIPNLVQAHGVLIALDEDLNIAQISENCREHFSKSVESLLGKPLENLLNSDYFAYLRTEVLPQTLEANPLYLNPATINDTDFEAAIHRFQDVTIIEFERPSGQSTLPHQNHYSSLRSKLNEINQAKSVVEFCQKSAETVRKFTGFDRVMIYRFAEDDSGDVIAEAAHEDLEKFLGLHYPASDIPKQARALYIKQSLRFKVDVDAASSPVTPKLNPSTRQPLDMSYAATREMSPIHNEYLKNMGVASSMSISIVKDGRLWGLIACHHYSGGHYIPHQARMICEFIAHTISLQIEAKTNAENYEYINHLKDSNAAILEELNASGDVAQCLVQNENNLLQTIKSDGAALVLDNKIHLIGETPTEFQTKKLVEWLWKNHSEENFFATNELSRLMPSAEEYRSEASGVLAVRLTQKMPEYLIWFRAEQARTVNWAGNPEKPVTVGKFGARLTPRKSFETWKQEVRGQSEPWKPFEIEFAQKLRRTIVEVILRRVDELRELNSQLEASNAELDSFAYVASHDLKEPLRGISNYSNFLIEDYGEQLDEEAVGRLKTLVRLTDRMENLLDSLLHYSRVGRMDLQKKETDLHEILQDTLLFLQTRIEENKVEIVQPKHLPKAFADEVRVGEIFTNLISNAVKYNEKDTKKIEIGYLENAVGTIADESKTEHLFYVRDNGIGIDERHHADIFRIFKRLHGRNEYGGGVGAGLTIVKKIVERHGGRIWLESKSGEGTTFYFTLG